jgi:hypothetical protein
LEQGRSALPSVGLAAPFFDRSGKIPRLEKRGDSAAKDQASRVGGSITTGMFHHLETVWIWE